MITRCVLYLLGAGIFAILAINLQKGVLAVVLAFIALVLFIGFVLALFEFGIYQIGTYERDAVENERIRAEAASITPETHKWEIASKMNKDQLDFMNKHPGLEIERQLRTSPLTPKYYLLINQERFDYDDINLMIENSNPPDFCPIRRWPEGSRQRDVCTRLTTALIRAGYLEEAIGNRPATAWEGMRGWNRMIASIGGDVAENDNEIGATP